MQDGLSNTLDHGEKRSLICENGLCTEELDQSGSMSIICAVLNAEGSKCT